MHRTVHDHSPSLTNHLSLSHCLFVSWVCVNVTFYSAQWKMHFTWPPDSEPLFDCLFVVFALIQVNNSKPRPQYKVNCSPRTKVQSTVQSEQFTKNRARCRCTSPQPPDSKPLTFSANFTQISLHQILLLLVMFFCNQLFWPTFLTSSTHFIKYTNTLSRNHFYEHEFFFSELLTFWRNWNNLHLQFSFDSCCLTTFQLVLSCWL